MAHAPTMTTTTPSAHTNGTNGVATTAGPTPPSVPAPGGAPSIDLSGEATSPGKLARQVWRSRELLVILARKEFHVRYRRASFGLLWALGLPLMQSLVLAVVFSHVAHIHNAPHYAVFVLSGMTAWVYFSTALGAGATAIVDGTDLSSRVYFPRCLAPLAQVGTNLYAFAISLVLLVGLCPLFGVGLTVRILWLLPASVLLVALMAGLSLVLSALHVYFRDIRYLVAASLIVWMYITPVIYPPAAAPRALRALLAVNPMTGVVDLFHYATVGPTGPMAVAVCLSVGYALVLLVVGVALQCRFDRVFVDLL